MGVVTWILIGMFISVIFIIGRIDKKRGPQHEGATWLQKHVAMVGVFAVVVPIIIGIVLVNTVFSTTTDTKAKITNVKIVPKQKYNPPEPPEPLLKLVVSDGSRETKISVLNSCAREEVTIVQNGLVKCVKDLSPELRAWINDAEVQQKNRINSVIRYKLQHAKCRPQATKIQNKKPTVMQQGFFWAPSPTSPPKTKVTSATVKKKIPFKDRNSELFYFLALVMGVLGKYFWDFYENKRVGKAVSFHPHLIIMSFIIAALVYYSIQQGFEKEGSKLTMRGVVFAFNNGFMWQTILTSLNRSKNGITQPAEEKPNT